MITRKKIQTLYPDVRQSVQEYMYNAFKYLESEYGEVKAEWKAALSLLSESLEMYYQCKDQIKKDGLLIQDRYGNPNKHPLLQIQTAYQIQILKVVKELGLSPLASSKIADKPEKEDTMSAEDFITKLTQE
ncbi:P27 family phage terminase small subunit [Prevotella histicola]|uniref:P27 family phage terminase small subunit n=1 Tax=Prevotella histicola TaxID=470565 RepID=UPI001CB1A148|nr:P27 family phage terminase small subunit [Prevotella histicola]MBF1400179.1 P27 family phage terminase small subunit [Prevotella histicola]